MLNSEVIDTIMARLAGRTAASTRTIVVQELNEKIRQLERGPLKPWFLEKRITGTLPLGVDSLELPTDFLEEYEEGSFRIQLLDGKWTDPLKVDIEKLESETDGVNPGPPEGYSLFGDLFYLGPVPDVDYTYKLKYYGRTDAVADNESLVLNPWLLEFFNFVTLATAYIVAVTHLQSTDMAAKMQQELTVASDGFFRAVESRKHVNMDYLLGGSEN